jgi:hypothetical protein
MDNNNTNNSYIFSGTDNETKTLTIRVDGNDTQLMFLFKAICYDLAKSGISEKKLLALVTLGCEELYEDKTKASNERNNSFLEETPTNNRKTWAYYKLSSTGSFATALCRAWELADNDNRKRLKFAYPRLFGIADTWERANKPKEFLEDILRGENDR